MEKKQALPAGDLFSVRLIEKMWSLRKVKARDPESLCAAIGQAMALVTKQDVRNRFASCGYGLT
jgi:hypothetical protein